MKAQAQTKLDPAALALNDEVIRLSRMLRRWEELTTYRKSLEADRAAKLKPHREKFDKAAEPIVTRSEKELAPIVKEIEQIEADLNVSLLAKINADGAISIPQIETAKAIAEVTTEAKREIAPAEFFDLVPAANRHSNFWNCLRVLVGEADKYLGKKTVTTLAKFTRSHGVTIRLKDNA